MLFARHRVADIINEGRTINKEFDYRQIKDDTKMLFRDYDKERRRQELYEKMNNILNNRLSKQIISKDVLNTLDYIFVHVNRYLIGKIIFYGSYTKKDTIIKRA